MSASTGAREETGGGRNGGGIGKPGRVPAPLAVALAATALCFALVGMLVRGLANPRPHDLPVAIVASPGQLNVLSSRLDQTLPGAFDLRHYQTAAAARDAVTDGHVVAAFLPRDGSATLWTAGAQGQFTLSAVRKAFRAIAQSQHLSLADTDLVPLPQADSAGLAPFLVIPGLTIASIAFGVLLSLIARAARPAERLLALLGFVAAASSIAALVTHSWIGALQTEYWELTGVFALITGAIASSIVALARAVGRVGLALAALTILTVGYTTAGAAPGYRFLPTMHRDISQWLPPGAGTTVVRAATYFDLGSSGMQLAVLVGWCAVALTLLVTEQFRRAGTAPASTYHLQPGESSPQRGPDRSDASAAALHSD